MIKDEKISEQFLKLTELIDSNLTDAEKNIMLKSIFAQILVHSSAENSRTFESNIHPVTEKVIEYIDNNIENKLTVTNMANKLYISPSHLAHIFKKDLNIPVHKYILEKRLVLANKKIKNSVNPIKAASECGFIDYSGFYRQYKKMFGESPAETKKIKVR